MSAISIITSLGLGALHAIEPGHGKTFLVSYSMANDVDKKQAVKIITSLAISHGVLLILLALVVPVMFPHIEESIHFYIQLTASLLVLYVGVRVLLKSKKLTHHDENCGCGHDHKNNTLLQSYKPAIQKIQHAKFSLAQPKNLVNKPKKNAINSNPALVGFINGIMPCPSALAVVGMAFTYSSAWIISLTMLAYVAGFILAMFLLLMGFVVFKSKFLKMDTSNKKLQERITSISGIVIILSGFYYLFMAFNHTH